MVFTESEMQLDVHTHTLASGHAYGTIREMAQAAAEKGLPLLGLSEHDKGIPGACDALYFINLYGVRLLYGAEINILNGGRLSMSDSLMDALDYRIAGIHTNCYTPSTVEAHTADTLAAIRHPKIQIISHPDDGETQLDYGQIVPAAKEHNTLLEVNNNALRKMGRRLRCGENYREMLRLCKKYEAPVLFSSDAHDPGDVRNMRYIRSFMAELDFPGELVVNTSAQRFLTFLETGRL